MTVIHLLQLNQCPIFEQLQIEEALLRADQRNWCIVNKGSLPAIVMGISGKPEQLITSQMMQSSPVPVIRRFSGGGTVFVDHNTHFVTMICNEHCVGVPCFPEQVLKWNATWVEKALKPLPFCLMENDYVLGNQKFGGNAQYLSKKRWLHHTSFLWDYEKVNMDYLQIPPKMPQYRDQRSHQDFLCRLKDHLTSPDLFIENFIRQLNGVYVVTEVNQTEAIKIKDIPHRQATTYL